MANATINLTSTYVNYSNVYNYINTCSQQASIVDGLPKASQNSAFQILESLGLSGGFPTQFDNSMNEISNFISTLSSGCMSYVNDIENQDKSIMEDFIPPGGTAATGDDYGSVVRTPGGGGGGGSNSFGNKDSVRKLDSKEDKTKIKTDGDTALSSISDEDYEELIEVLKKISKDSNVGIDELLDEKYNDVIKEALLNNVKLSSEFKEIIQDESTISVASSLKSLIDGKLENFKTDDVMSSTLVDYLELYAKDNNITYDELINDEKNYDILKKGLEDFSKVGEVVSVVNEESIQQKLLDIYQEKVAVAAPTSAVKSYVDNLSEKSSTDYEKLLTDDKYKSEVYETTEDLKNASQVADVLSSCSQNQIIDTLKNIHIAKKDKENG